MSTKTEELRMSAYYFGFQRTGDPKIDRILSAVACAGKAYHHTEQWEEEAGERTGHTGTTPVEWIQNAANDAAQVQQEPAARDIEWQAINRVQQHTAGVIIAAVNLLAAVDERHDTQDAPQKYTVPYGAVNALRAALDSAPAAHTGEVSTR